MRVRLEWTRIERRAVEMESSELESILDHLGYCAESGLIDYLTDECGFDVPDWDEEDLLVFFGSDPVPHTYEELFTDEVEDEEGE